jgi:hypothetical protein
MRYLTTTQIKEQEIHEYNNAIMLISHTLYVNTKDLTKERYEVVITDLLEQLNDNIIRTIEVLRK